MYHSTQKRKLTEYLRGIHFIMLKNKCTELPFYRFQNSWKVSEYNQGISYIAIDLLYCIITQNKTRIIGIANRIISEKIEGYINSEGLIQGEIKKPKKGLSLLGWILLEKLQENDIEFFENLYILITEKNVKKNVKNT